MDANRTRWSRAAVGMGAAALLVAGLFAAPPAVADHETAATSEGVYRIPYVDGTDVSVNNWHHNHNVAYDMNAGVGSEIVAAASGWIRAIVDNNGQEPNPGDGVDVQTPVPQPQDDALEHACGNNDPTNTVWGDNCGWYNNYVWIEHPNGEYTKYSHFGTGTVSANWTEGDWIEAGEVIGLENDVGAASTTNGEPGDRAYHLHWEVAVSDTPGVPLTWGELGGFITNGSRVIAQVCDIPDNELVAGDYVAAPCDHEPPTAVLGGGPFTVDEGDTIFFDASDSSDPEGNPLTYRWEPESLGIEPVAMPELTLTDDFAGTVTLTVYDQIEALWDSASQDIVVQNVPPTVSVEVMPSMEAGVASVSATVSDPGTDTFAAEIDWGDGGPSEPVTIAQLAVGVDHVYGDDGAYPVAVTVTDDDGGVGVGAVALAVGNLDPEVELTVDGTVSFPGGDYAVVEAGGTLAAGAEATDAGSDDLTFSWSTGDVTTYFNDGVAPDPPLSPFGTFPFAASDGVDELFAAVGVESFGLTVTDDDGGSVDAEAGVIVTGTADSAFGQGWWMHQYSGKGAPHVDAATAAAYLEIVAAVSGVFSELEPLSTPAQAHEILAPPHDGWHGRARAELLGAWLHFASGAVPWDATVTLQSGVEVAFLDLMAEAEDEISSPATTDAELRDLVQDLSRVRHAAP